ncbi:MAG TPA: hypothetical protein VGM27_27680, partial [Acidobacteriaceae bacterium]
AQNLKIDDNNVQARLHQGAGGAYLWIINPTRNDRPVKVSLGSGNFTFAEDIWGKQHVTLNTREISTTVPARDAVVAALG